MHELLKKYIEEKTSIAITEQEFEQLKLAFIPKRLRRRQYFLQEGDICKFSAFIAKGAMRQFSVDDKGMEHTINLGIENWWMSDRESFLMEIPSKYNIEATEDCDLLLMDKEANAKLREKSIPAFTELFRILDQNHFIATEKRMHAAITLTAEEKYQDILNTRPEFLQRFPQHMIASYLGISPETLSRVRSQMASK